MKKIISIILVAMLTFVTIPVEAAKTPSLDFLNVTYVNTPDIEQTGKLAFTLNKPILCLASLEEMLNESDIMDTFDIKALVEGLFGSEITFTAKVKTENEGQKISSEMHMQSGFPVVINNNLNFDANTNMSVWLDVDLGADTGINYIMATPAGSKYIVMNSDDFLKTADDESLEESFDAVKKILAPSEMEQMNGKLIDSLRKNSVVTGNSRSVKIVFTDIGLKKYISDAFAIAFEMMGENPFDEESSEFITDVFTKVPFFADEAAVMECTLDSKGRITGQRTQINVDLNLYNLMTAFGEYTDGLTPENSDISFSMIFDSAIKYNNVTITKPELTEDNSIDYAEYMEPAYEPEDMYENYEYYDRWPSFDVDSMFLTSGDSYYIPLRNVLEAYSYEVGYENGVITAVTDSKFADYKSLEFVINSPVVVTSEGEVTLGNAPVIIGDKTYIPMFDAEILLKSSAYSYNNYFGYGQSVDFYRMTDFEY